MSQENVEIVRGLLARWERGDRLRDTVEAFDPQVEFTRTGGGSDVLGYATKSHGIEGLWAALVAWTEEWSDVRMQAERFIEVGERVLVLARHRAVGKRSGVPMNHLDAWVFSIGDGRIVRWDAYWDPADANRALGLEE
jgi:ketosteroid isomerase-like protein